jgi:hypothetical protein
MKKHIIPILLILTLPVLLPADNWKVGDRVEMRGKSSGLWFPATVKNVEGNTYYVLSDGWNEDEVSECDESFLRVITKNEQVAIRKGGSVWATVGAEGRIRIGGNIVGEFSDDGTVRKSGTIVGKIEYTGKIRKGGNLVGAVEPMGDIRRGGNIIAGFAGADGTIRLSGSIWGKLESFSKKWRDVRAAMAVLAFFSADFGY